MELTAEQFEQAKAIMEKTADIRKKVTLYRKGDIEMAMFRVQAMNIIQDAVIRKVTEKKRVKKINDFVEYWNDNSELGNNIQELFKAIEEG